MATETKTTPWVCERCGRTFSRKQGLGRHMHETHGAPTTREAASTARANRRERQTAGAVTADATTIAEVDAEVQEMLVPLRKRLAAIDAEVAQKANDLAALRRTRAYVDGMIRKLSPPTKPTGAGGARVNADLAKITKRDALRRYLTKHAAQLSEGFTSHALHADIQRAGIQPRMSPPVILELLGDLRDLGFVRADRVTRGGGMLWQLVQTTNGKSGVTDG